MKNLFVLLCVFFLVQTSAIAQGQYPSSGGGGVANVKDKLSTADCFSDWLVNGCDVSVPGGVTTHAFAGTYTMDSCVSHDGAFFYASAFDPTGSYNYVYKISTTTFEVVATQTFVDASGYVASMVVSADNAHLYVVGYESETILYDLNTSDLSINQQVVLPTNNAFIALSFDGSKIATYYKEGGVAKIVTINTTTFGISSVPTATDYGANFIPAWADATHVWLFNDSARSLDRVLISNGSVTSSIVLSLGPYTNNVSVNPLVSTSTKAMFGLIEQSTGVSFYVIDQAGSGSEIARVDQAGMFGIGDSGNIQVAGSHGYFINGLNTGTEKNKIYQIPLDGNTSITVLGQYSLTLGEWEGIGVPDDESKVYSGLDDDLPGSLVGVFDNSLPSLTATVGAGVAYSGGNRVTPSATPHTFTASKDTYRFLSSAGAWTFTAVNNGASAPTGSGLLVGKTITDGSGVTSDTILAETVPTLNAIISGGISLSANQTWTGEQTFPDTKLLLQERGGTDYLVVKVEPQPVTHSITFPAIAQNDTIMVVTEPQFVVGTKYFEANSLALYEDGGTNWVKLNTTSRADNVTVYVPGDATDNSAFVMTTGASSITGLKSFDNGTFRMQEEGGGNEKVTLTVQNQDSNRILVVPNLGGFDDTIMTLNTSQIVGGTKSQATTIFTPAGAPGNPANGWVVYCDSGDSNKLKIKKSDGTIVDLSVSGGVSLSGNNLWGGTQTYPNDVLLLKEAGGGSDTIHLNVSAQPGTYNLLIPSLAGGGGDDAILVTRADAAQIVITPVTFDYGALGVFDQSANTITIKPVSSESTNRILFIPTLGANDTIMTLTLAQTIGGAKTFANNDTLFLTSSNGQDIKFHINNQTGNHNQLIVPDFNNANQTMVLLGLSQTITGLKTIDTATADKLIINDGNQVGVGVDISDQTSAGTLVIPDLFGGVGVIMIGGSSYRGSDTLGAGGTKTVTCTLCTTSSIIGLTDTGSSIVNLGSLQVRTKNNGSFVVFSSNVADSSTFDWWIVKP